MYKKNFANLTLLALLVILPFTWINAQVSGPVKVKKSVAFDKSRKLSDVRPLPPIQRDRFWKDRVVKNKFNFIDELKNQPILDTDPVLQNFMPGMRSEPTVYANFSGVDNRNGFAPPDTDGDVGPNHYMQIVNCSFEIFDKDGNSVYGPADNITLWDGFDGPWSTTNDGDPVVLYDEYAGRWIASQFSYSSGFWYELVAVSATDDPTGAWYRYAFEFDHFPDYPKFGIWPDGYYLTVNQFEPWAGAGISALDRDAMINGETEATMVFFDVGYNYGSLLPADLDGDNLPPEDQPMVFVNLGSSYLRLWEVEIDWDDVDNSTLSYAGAIPTASFSTNGISINQPGTAQELDAVSDRLMFRLQYRNFGDYQAMVTNHTVNAGGGRAGVRWYELRNYSDNWEMYQQGTYAPEDGNSRWLGSVAMNASGDIAVGYSVSSSSTYPSIRIAGQTNGAPMGLGVLDIDEITIKEGSASQSGTHRWGDYSKMSVDVDDDETFWYTTEYTTGGWSWKTQIASFGFAQQPSADFDADELLIPVGEVVNFTDLTTGIPDEWSWTFVGGDPENSTDQNPESILYNTEGSFDVQLIASNLIGNDTIIKEDYIVASTTALPGVDFEADKDFVCTNEAVKFTDHTTVRPNQWQWEFSPSTVTFVNETDLNSQNPEVVFNEAGNYSVTLTAWNLNGSANLTIEDMVIAGGYIPYFKETFEDNGFASQNWTVENPDNDITWSIYEVGGTTPGNMAAGINFGIYYEMGERDRLISPPFNLEGLSSAALEFRHAYAKRHFEITDSLIIYVSDDCANTWTRVFAAGEDGTGNFATHEQVDEFWPEVYEDWCGAGWGANCIDIDLTPWAGQPDIRIAFESYSAYGNPLFIDNVTISQYVDVDEIETSEDITVYPNPTTGNFNVIIPENIEIDNIQLVNHIGQVVYFKDIDHSAKSFEIRPQEGLSSGIYFLKSQGEGNLYINKVIIY